jgi:CubicO group peptidase (beta-lactamase class C family)
VGFDGHRATVPSAVRAGLERRAVRAGVGRRGELDVDAPVARYWPGFEAGGKEAVLVRHVMSHTAGLSGWAEPMTLEDLCDWDKATGILARQGRGGSRARRPVATR